MANVNRVVSQNVRELKYLTEGDTWIPGDEIQDSIEGDTRYWEGVTVSHRRQNTISWRRRNTTEANTRAWE